MIVDVLDLIVQECDEVARLLIRKNKAYGNSFAEPIHVFSKLTPETAKLWAAKLEADGTLEDTTK